MPRAGGNIAEQVKYHYQDHDTDVVDERPPVQNTWYEVFDAEDVRLLRCQVYQSNDENAAKDIEVRWTIDGTVYLGSKSLEDITWECVYRDFNPSAGGTVGLLITPGNILATYYTDKRGLDFKVEVRITSVIGTNQQLRCYCVRETLEET